MGARVTTFTPFTHPFTVDSGRGPFTRPRTLHAAPLPERGTPFTDTFTTFTAADLHAGPPHFSGGPVVGMGGR